jgi:hypothetical protein
MTAAAAGLRKLAFEPLEPRHLLDGANAALELFSLQPALFVENQGQWADQSVRYVTTATA